MIRHTVNAVSRAWLLVLALCLLPGAASAAESQPAAEPTPDTPEEPEGSDKSADASDAVPQPDKPADDPAGKVVNGKDESPGIFVPSEDISEDFAVSFPVDI